MTVTAEEKRRIKEVDREFKRRKRAQGRKIDSSGRLLPANPNKDQPLRDFVGNVDMAVVQQALVETGDEKALALASMMMNPTERRSFPTLCRAAGVTLQQLNELWRKHNLALGMVKMASRLPKVMEDTAQDAESRYSLCPRCDGLGTVTRAVKDNGGNLAEVDEECPQCHGAREVRVPGDSKARDLTFETMGLTGKTAPMLAQQFIIGGDESFEGLIGAAQKVITIRPESKGENE
jgi:hypothetical protein